MNWIYHYEGLSSGLDLDCAPEQLTKLLQLMLLSTAAEPKTSHRAQRAHSVHRVHKGQSLLSEIGNFLGSVEQYFAREALLESNAAYLRVMQKYQNLFQLE